MKTNSNVHSFTILNRLNSSSLFHIVFCTIRSRSIVWSDQRRHYFNQIAVVVSNYSLPYTEYDVLFSDKRARSPFVFFSNTNYTCKTFLRRNIINKCWTARRPCIICCSSSTLSTHIIQPKMGQNDGGGVRRV